jgi:hypothetical protein
LKFIKKSFLPGRSWHFPKVFPGKITDSEEPVSGTASHSLLLIFLFTLAFNLIVKSSCSQSPDYPAIFGDDWKKAERFVSDNRSWMELVLRKNHISYPLAIAVIFPELVRYSALRDKMEITLLKALYINLGDQYANFSVGHFQMKPSFAQIIREQADNVLPRRSGISFRKSREYKDPAEYRKSIVADLEKPETEFSYLIVFLKICDRNFMTNRMDEIQKLKFIATAYNFGVDKSAEEIDQMTGKKFFNTKMFSTENYSYADISLYWYNHYNSENK